MSTFKGIIKEIPGISVDRFDGENLKSHVFFLSHCHSDHMKGLNEIHNFLKTDICIYMSKISSIIIQEKYPNLMKYVRALEINDNHLIVITENNTDKYISVVLIPAGHCPGSVMFLFEKPDNTLILYTGDFRMSLKSLKGIETLHNSDGSTKTIHKMYFDSTFWDYNYMDFPTRRESCDILCSIINEWISKGKDYLVSLNIPAWFGSEFLYRNIYNRFNMPIHVGNLTYTVYRQVKDIGPAVTNNPHCTQIHSCFTNLRCGKPRITCRNVDKSKIRHVRPSAMLWKMWKRSEAIFKEDHKMNYFNVCYSSHCSYNELKEFLLYLKPNSVKPCVVPENDAIEFFQSLNEFTKSFSTLTKTVDSYVIKDDNVFNSFLLDSESEVPLNEKRKNKFEEFHVQPTNSIVCKKKIRLF